jgi:hypothetical protein
MEVNLTEQQLNVQALQQCKALVHQYNGRNRPAGVTSKDWLRPRWDQPFSRAALYDPLWRLNHIYHFIDTHGHRHVYKLKPAMFEVWSEQHARNVLLKARQYGYTTLWLLDMLDDCLTRPNRSAQLTAHNLDDAKELFGDKAKYAYTTLDQWEDDDPLPEGCTIDNMIGVCQSMKASVKLVRETAEILQFSNNSKLRVTTSGRSGTLQRLHVSELGKIAHLFPEKAKEVRTGSIPATSKAAAQGTGQIWIESTAEGQQGLFKELCDESQQLEQMLKANPRALTPQEWKFHFHAWHDDSDYVADPSTMVIHERLQEYFIDLETKHDVHLTPAQKAWYVATEAEQKSDMKREYPSTPQEAFEAAIEGAYFEKQMRAMREEGRILTFDISQTNQVHSLWDIGASDDMVCILWQPMLMQNRIIGYHEATGESFAYWKTWLDDYRTEHKIVYGTHYGPHDLEQTRLGATQNKSALERAFDIGLYYQVLPAPQEKQHDIDGLRDWMATVHIHEVLAAKLPPHLDGYCKQWDSRNGRFRDKPSENGHQHAADAAMNGPKAENSGVIARPTARKVVQSSLRGHVA